MRSAWKRILCVFLFGLIISGAVPAVSGIDTVITAEAASTVALSKKTVSLAVSGSTTIQLKNTSSKKKVTWSSSKKSVATVKASGTNGYKVKITGKKAGTATITAKYNGKKYTVKVTVKAPALSKKSLSLNAGKTGTITLNNIVSSKKVTWKSSKTSIATVKAGKNGKVIITAKKKGTATITATYNKKKYTCKVKVTGSSSSQKITSIKKLKAAYPNEKDAAEFLLASIGGSDGKVTPYNITSSEITAIQKSIYKEIGVSKSTTPQYACWKIVKYVCDNVKYTKMNAATMYSVNENLEYVTSIGQPSCNAIYTLYLGEGVCANYAQTVKWLLDGLNITNYYATGLNHAWNQVKIDGKWYNIDATSIGGGKTDGNYSVRLFLYPDAASNIAKRSTGNKKCTSYRFIDWLVVSDEELEGSAIIYNGKMYSQDTRGNIWLTDEWKNL